MTQRPRDAAHWARYVETLKAPAGTFSPNVEGRRPVGPLQGFGKMWQKTYTVRLEGASPAEVVAIWRERFPEISGFGEKGFRVPPGGLTPGAVALLGGLSGVMVLYSDEESFTYMTPEGHPFSGWITFSAHRDEDATVAQAQLLIRANDPLYEIMMPLGLHRLEDRTWQRTLGNVAARFGADGRVETRVVCVDPKRQWRRYKNIRHNALVLSALYAITTPLRRIRRQASGHRHQQEPETRSRREEPEMTEATPPPEKDQKRPRDAAFWAQRVERLEVSAVPEGAANVNVQGRREVGALQGFGQLWQKTYQVRLTGAEVTPEEAVKIWKERFPEFQPPNSRFYPSMAGVAPGEVLFITASVGGMPVHTGVRVIYADDESFTVMTPEGHPESGWNTFSAFRNEDGVTVAQVQSLARANDPIYELGFRVVGSTEQERIWTHVLKSLAAHFGVNEPVTLEKACVDPKVQWSQMKNLWHNAGARSMLYTMTAPLRWRRRSKR